MVFKDRTIVFSNVVDSISSRRATPPGVKSKKSDRSHFAIMASQIGKDIYSTTEKLETLATLAKNKTLCEDRPIDIHELTNVINQDIKNLNRQILALQQQKSGKKNSQTDSHSDTVLDSLKRKLKHTTKDFSEILELRTENLKKQQEMRDKLTGSNSTYTSPQRDRNTLFSQTPPENDSQVVINMPQTSLLVQERYISSRAEAVVSIHRTLEELQNIFRQLNLIVAEQQDVLERVDENVNQTERNISGAQNQLMQYYQNISSNRWLFLKVFFVLIVFILILVVFFV